MAEFRAEQWVPVELPRVFAFFSDPQNLPVIMPPELATRVEEIKRIDPLEPGYREAAGAGSRVVFSFRPFPFLPLRLRWHTRIIDYEPGSFFRDLQERGPFASWMHTHRFFPEQRNGVNGTVITDEVRFTLSYGILGKWMEGFVAEKMRSAFAHRQRRLEEILTK